MADIEDDIDDVEDYQWIRMREMGISEEEIARAKQTKQWKDDVYLYSLMIKQRAWNFDESCTIVGTYLRLCSALEGLGRRQEAISRLTAGLESCPLSPDLTLALAKLSFKDDQKEKSLELCHNVYEMFDDQNKECSDSEIDNDEMKVTVEHAEDAYYLGGWVKIHDDDHTNAYRIWKEGHLKVPSSELLVTQYRKRICWDAEFLQVDPKVQLYFHVIFSSPYVFVYTKSPHLCHYYSSSFNPLII